MLEQNRALLRAADEGVAADRCGTAPDHQLHRRYVTNTYSNRPGVKQHAQSDASNVNIGGFHLDLLLYDFGRLSSYGFRPPRKRFWRPAKLCVSVEQQVLLRGVQAVHERAPDQRTGLGASEQPAPVMRQELRAAKDRFEVGEMTRTDVALAEARLAAAQSGLAIAQGDLSQAVEEFRAVTGRKPGAVARPGKPAQIVGRYRQGQGHRRAQSPGYVACAIRPVAAAELTVSAASAAMKPRVGLSARPEQWRSAVQR